MISMKFPLFTYIYVLGNWFTTKVVTWNDLQCWFCSDHHGVARCWLDITRLLLFIRDSKRPTAQLAKETKGRREGKKERSFLFLTISPRAQCSTHFRCWGKTGNYSWLGGNEIQRAQRNQLLATPKILFAFKSCPFLRLISIFTRGFLGYALSSFYLGPSGEYFSCPDGTKNHFVDFVLDLIFRAN